MEINRDKTLLNSSKKAKVAAIQKEFITMSVDIDQAVDVLKKTVREMVLSTHDKIPLARIDQVTADIAKRIQSEITDAKRAADFAARNPQVLEAVNFFNPDGTKIWEAISSAAADYVRDQLNGTSCGLFIVQFDVDFDPVFEFQYFANELVDEWENLIIEESPEDIPAASRLATELRGELKQDILKEEVLDQVGKIAAVPKLKNKHSAEYQILREAYHVRTGFEQRQAFTGYRG
jgi:hypothetical protein